MEDREHFDKALEELEEDGMLDIIEEDGVEKISITEKGKKHVEEDLLKEDED